MDNLKKKYGDPISPHELAKWLGLDVRTVRKYSEKWGGLKSSLVVLFFLKKFWRNFYMPTYTMKNGRRRVRAAVMVKGISRKKWFPDDSKASYRAAASWEAEQKLEIEKLQIRTESSQTSTSVTAHEWLSKYLDYVKPRVVMKTYVEKKAAARRFLKYAGPESLVATLNIAIVEKYLADRNQKVSGNASNKDRKNLAAAWKWGEQYIEGFHKNGNLFAKVAKHPEIRKPRYVPPEEDFWAVLNVTSGQDRVMLLTLLHLALRRGELFRLKWTDIEWESSAVRVGNKKNKIGQFGYDYLPLTNELKKELEIWQESRPLKNTTHVFTQIYNSPSRWHEPGRPFVSRQHFLKEMCALAGVKVFGFHAIRHLSASILYKAGYTQAVIQRILRHKSPTTTALYMRKLGLIDIKIDDEVFRPKK